MTTKPSNWWIDRGIYDGAFDAFTNYMNILGDFISRVRTLYGGIDNEELENMLTTITNQGKEIESQADEIARLRAKLAKYEGPVEEKSKAAAPAAKKPVAKKPAVKKPAAKKPAAKKAPAKKAEPAQAEPVKVEPAAQAEPTKTE